MNTNTETGGFNDPVRNAYDPVNLFRARLVDFVIDLQRRNLSYWDLINAVDEFIEKNRTFLH